ncbi:MAG: hypothetical protein A4E52_01063 [Pelotomaculum sp. PtaB.Bin013]|nr:MAG: hypothetical protein A4E52_01063 [Pelotomaculum sp. PtaB.Bin013]
MRVPLPEWKIFLEIIEKYRQYGGEEECVSKGGFGK